MIDAKKNAAYYLSFPAIDSTSPASYATGLSPVDTAYYKDGAGAWTSLAITDTATEIGSTGVYEIDLTAAEMNHDRIIIKFAVSGMADDAYQFDLRAKLVDDLQDLTAAQVNTEVDTGITDAALATAAALATVDAVVDGIQTDLSNATDGLGAIKADTAAILLDTNELQTDDIPATLATIAAYIDTEIGTIITNLATVDTVVDGIQTDLSNGTDGLGALKTLIDTLDTVADAIKVKTDSLTFTQAGHVDSNVQRVNDVLITGDGNATPFDVV